MPLFCRHNRFEQNCPICSREKAAKQGPARAGAPARRAASPRRTGAREGRPSSGVVTRRLARAADDGYRNDLVPGIKATEDAERLAAAVAAAAARLEFPGPHPAVAEIADPDDATWLAFLLALAGPDRPDLQAAVAAARPAWADRSGATGLGESAEATIAAYRAWVERAGGQRAAFTGEAGWSPERRFGRVLQRLSLPGFGRAQRFELLTTLGAAGVYELEADALHVGSGEDATVLGAKRALLAGDTMFLERRARALASGLGVRLAALDRGLAAWETGAAVTPPEGELHERARAGLGLR